MSQRYRQLPLFGPDEYMPVVGVSRNEEWIAAQGFTPKQEEILNLLIRRFEVKDVATALGKAPTTIYTHIDRMLGRCHCRSVAEMVAMATYEHVELEPAVTALRTVRHQEAV